MDVKVGAEQLPVRAATCDAEVEVASVEVVPVDPEPGVVTATTFAEVVDADTEFRRPVKEMVVEAHVKAPS
jgi:hypothetical protein